MTDADVAAVLDGAVLGEFGVWQGTCPVCSDPKGTQIYARDGRMIVDHACRCSPKAVRARDHGTVRRALRERVARAAHAPRRSQGQGSQRPRRSRGPLGRNR